jgi:hypothetical protein
MNSILEQHLFDIRKMLNPPADVQDSVFASAREATGPLAFILSAMRGPDNAFDCGKLKSRTTDPIRAKAFGRWGIGSCSEDTDLFVLLYEDEEVIVPVMGGLMFASGPQIHFIIHIIRACEALELDIVIKGKSGTRRWYFPKGEEFWHER